jgi:uncharacterized pyridoxal phosphate-containing UPF0001 family protein
VIRENVKRLLSELPEGVALLAAAKERTAGEISEAIRAGITIIGENYLQDAQKVLSEVMERAEWHFIMPVLIEVNSGEEEQKYGVLPKDLPGLIKEISSLKNIKIMGLMTMGPRFGNPEESRPYFIKTRRLFEQIKDLHLPNVEMKHLSMGMTNSYEIAIEEGANLVRIGTKIFGARRK